MSFSFKKIFPWVLRGVAAFIMLQTLFFKFTAAPESVYIFTELGIEPWGRIGSGVMELIASVLLLIPRTTVLGALLAMGIMGGAILSHIFVLGVVIQDDGGQLFIYALLVLICSAILFWMYRRQLGRFIQQRFVPFLITNA
ncbi:MAG: DoxX family protein [Bacteroidota bacterium]